MKIPFNKPYLTGGELINIQKSGESFQFAGDGKFTRACHERLVNLTKTRAALLTHSCTAALELSALLIDVEPGDEVIVPSYTFVSTASAFVLRGAKIVFSDIREDTLNLDESKLPELVTPRTKAIVPVHYAGVGCDMDYIMALAREHDLAVVEDAAQAIQSSYKGQPLGSFGDLGALSFHETKNVISGEGGALLVNRSDLIERAEILREKGTDRSRFFRGQVDKYTWQDVGSSFLPGELIAAFLSAQLDHAQEITNKRLKIWEYYHSGLEELERQSLLKRPTIPDVCQHNAHMYYILLPEPSIRQEFLRKMNNCGVGCVFHYVPLHDSPAGKQFGEVRGNLSKTENLSSRLVRLPLWIGLSEQEQDYVIESIKGAINSL